MDRSSLDTILFLKQLELKKRGIDFDYDIWYEINIESVGLTIWNPKVHGSYSVKQNKLELHLSQDLKGKEKQAEKLVKIAEMIAKEFGHSELKIEGGKHFRPKDYVNIDMYWKKDWGEKETNTSLTVQLEEVRGRLEKKFKPLHFNYYQNRTTENLMIELYTTHVIEELGMEYNEDGLCIFDEGNKKQTITNVKDTTEMEKWLDGYITQKIKEGRLKAFFDRNYQYVMLKTYVEENWEFEKNDVDGLIQLLEKTYTTKQIEQIAYQEIKEKESDAFRICGKSKTCLFDGKKIVVTGEKAVFVS